jgi:hypothetical protein
MNNYSLYFFLLFIPGLVLPDICLSQENYTLSGYVRDQQNGEELIGATITTGDMTQGTTTNRYGFYSLTFPAGTYVIVWQFLGFEPFQDTITLNQNIRRDVELTPRVKKIDEVVVRGRSADPLLCSAEMGVERMSTRDIKALPVLMGEQDIIKSMQLLPGISPVSEGSSGFYVRGGDASQNLILLDEAPVYNASHLMGFFSVFNSDAINDVKIMKGFVPPSYGDRLSSVLDVKMKEGNNKNFSGSGGLGLVSSRLQLEGPFAKHKGSFMVTGRRTYADLFLKMIPDTNINRNALYFYDFNAKANYRVGPKDRIFLSGYLGRDVFSFRKMFGIDWGNQTLTARWNHLFSDRLFLNSSLIYSNYNYNFNIIQEDNEFFLRSFIRDLNWKEDFQFYASARSTFRFGLKSNYHLFLPGETSSIGDFPIHNMQMEKKNAWENALYASHKWKASSTFTFHYGIRFATFSLLGPLHVYRFDTLGNTIDTTWYAKGKFIKTYPLVDPRFLVNIRLSPHASVKLSYTGMHQFLHLLSNSTSGTPLDLWIPSSLNVKPQISQQVSAGYFRTFSENMFEISLEVYYKKLSHQIDYKTGASLYLNEEVESQLVYGKGKAYGAEFLLRKNKGRLHGWIGYTLSRSLRQFRAIDNGKVFPAKQDRIHDLSVVGIYDLNDRWSFSATWVYYTGNAVTFPSGKYIIENSYINYYTDRNGYRMPAYHRLDLNARLGPKRKRKWESSWDFSIYNVYARKNAYSITFRTKENAPNITEAVKLYLFTIVPTVTYNFKF